MGKKLGNTDLVAVMGHHPDGTEDEDQMCSLMMMTMNENVDQCFISLESVVYDGSQFFDTTEQTMMIQIEKKGDDKWRVNGYIIFLVMV